MLVSLYFLSYLIMLGKTFEKQIFLDSNVKKISKAAFYLQLADQVTDHQDVLKEQKENVGKMIQEVEQMGISLTDAFYKDGMVDIRLNYYRQSFFWNHTIQIKQRARMRDWRGVDITDDKDMVYITKTGKVFHRNKNCRYLNVRLRKVDYNAVANLRNDNGEKYSRCEICGRDWNGTNAQVYITTDGNRYHVHGNCSGISRYVLMIHEKDVGNRKPCSLCGG
jgi:hypothetical protein